MKVGCGQSAARKKTITGLLKARNINIDSKRFSRKQNVSPDVFVFQTLHITPSRLV